MPEGKVCSSFSQCAFAAEINYKTMATPIPLTLVVKICFRGAREAYLYLAHAFLATYLRKDVLTNT